LLCSTIGAVLVGSRPELNLPVADFWVRAIEKTLASPPVGTKVPVPRLHCQTDVRVGEPSCGPRMHGLIGSVHDEVGSRTWEAERDHILLDLLELHNKRGEHGRSESSRSLSNGDGVVLSRRGPSGQVGGCVGTS
jgi:hypothetical protein